MIKVGRSVGQDIESQIFSLFMGVGRKINCENIMSLRIGVFGVECFYVFKEIIIFRIFLAFSAS